LFVCSIVGLLVTLFVGWLVGRLAGFPNTNNPQQHTVRFPHRPTQLAPTWISFTCLGKST
jgi:hypothetical protein